MAATVDIYRITGAGAGSGASITSSPTRMKQADNGTADTNNPVPAVTTSVSCWVSTRLRVGSTGPSNLINNIQWYTENTANPSGLSIFGAKAFTGANAGYIPAVTTGLTVGGAGELTQSNHSGLDEAPVDIRANYTVSAMHALNGSTSGTSTLFGDHMVLQLRATSAANPGTMTARTMSWQYDET